MYAILQAAGDDEVWEHARIESFVLVTKDADFQTLSVVRSHPPKVLWIRSGNCATELIETLLRKNLVEIEKFVADPEFGFMALH